MLENAIPTSAQVTGDGVVGTSGTAYVVTAITLRSGTTDSSIALHNGTAATDTMFWKLSLDGTVAAGETTTSVSFPNGLVFPAGVFADIAGTSAEAWVAYQPVV